MDNDLLTTKQVMDYLRITRPQVYKLIKNGEINATNIGTGDHRPQYRIFKNSLDNFIQKGGVKNE